LNPGTKVFTTHGEPDACRDLAEYARNELGLDAIIPEKHHKYEI
jgi:putative mRNA 3-end processing factor